MKADNESSLWHRFLSCIKERRLPSMFQVAYNTTSKHICNLRHHICHSLDRLTLTPPCELRRKVGYFTNAHHFNKTGKKYVRMIIGSCNLKPNGYVLDVGCGCGHIAVPLTKYLNQSGMYEGFDIDGEMIGSMLKLVETI